MAREWHAVAAKLSVDLLAAAEGLEAITLLWSGEPVSFHGRYVTIEDVIMVPTPVQRPQVPIWVGGAWPHKAPARRAARRDGAMLTTASWDQPPDPTVIADMHAYIHAHRDQTGHGDEAFNLVGGGPPGSLVGRPA